MEYQTSGYTVPGTPRLLRTAALCLLLLILSLAALVAIREADAIWESITAFLKGFLGK
jgi:hypothetical protein